MVVVLNEREYAEDLLREDVTWRTAGHALHYIAKLYFSNGYQKEQVKEKLDDFLLSHMDGYNRVLDEDLIQQAIASSKGKQLVELDGVIITKAEIEKIQALDGKPMQRLMLTLLCLAKYHVAINEKNSYWVTEDTRDIFRMASVSVNVKKQNEMICELRNLGYVLDCMNQIANTEPVSMNDLGIIMQKSSAAMSAAGNTYQETLSLAAAVNGVLQDADTSGTYLKTLSMYLRASKTDAENAGIATDGMADSVSELRSELKQLAGVDIMKDDNTFKSTYQIMKELSEVWKDLSDTTQANITELISGKRGGQSTSALLNNFSVAEDAMKQALNSSGSAMRENQTYMDSLQAKLNQLDSAFQKFSTDLMKSDIPKFFISLATVFVDGADSAVKFAGALPTLTAAISGVLSVMQMSGKLKNGAGKVNMPSYICCV